MDPNAEFRELLEKAGWSQARAARELDFEPPTISRYVSGKDKPDKQTLRLFRMLIVEEAAQPTALREGIKESELEAWKRRARKAENDFHDLRQRLKHLLQATETAVAGVNSKPLSEAQEILKQASDRYDAEQGRPRS